MDEANYIMNYQKKRKKMFYLFSQFISLGDQIKYSVVEIMWQDFFHVYLFTYLFISEMRESLLIHPM